MFLSINTVFDAKPFAPLLCRQFQAPNQGIVMPATVRWTVAGIMLNIKKVITPSFLDGVQCSRYRSSRAVARQVMWLQMSLTSVFGMGSDRSAAGGRRSDWSEWQRSIKSRNSESPRILSGTATGERPERCLWQIKRGERVAAVNKTEE